MDSKPTRKEAAKAAAEIIGYYPELIASNRQAFAAGLVAMLSEYSREVVLRAMDPVRGIPSLVDRHELTLARIRKYLDVWAGERGHRQRLLERREQQSMLPPPRDPEQDDQMHKKLKSLAARLK